MTNKKDQKTTLALITGYFSFFAGWLIVFISFFVEPIGEISNSALYTLGEGLVYCGSVIGIAMYTKGEIVKIRKRVGLPETDDEDEED